MALQKFTSSRRGASSQEKSGKEFYLIQITHLTFKRCTKEAVLSQSGLPILYLQKYQIF